MTLAGPDNAYKNRSAVAADAAAKIQAAGQPLDDYVTGQLMNYATRGAWGEGDIVAPRYVADEDREYYQPPASPNDVIQVWRDNQWQANPENRNILGPNGEALPDTAVSWDYFGRPYFGEGLAGFWEETKWRWNDAFQVTKEENLEISETLERYKTAVADRYKGLLKGDVVGYFTPDIGGFVEGAGAALDAAAIGLSGEANQDGTNTITGIGKIAAATKTGVSALLDILQLGDETAERVVGTTVMTFNRWANQFTKDDVVPANVIRYRNPVTIPEWTNFQDVVNESWEASRIFYSSVKDLTLEQEFLRRMKAGDNPVYLAQEMGDPIAEMVGQIFISPWNVIGLAFKGTARVARYAKAESFFGASDEAAEVLQRVGQINKLDEAASVGVLDELAEIAIRDNARVAAGLSKQSKQHGIFAHLASAKQAIINENMDTMFKNLLASAKQRGYQTDDLMHVFEAIRDFGSGDAAKVKSALSILKNSNPELLLSDASHVLSTLLNKIDTAALFKRVKGADSLDEIIRITDETSQAASKILMPDVGELLARGEKVDAIAEWGYKANLAASQKIAPINRAFAAIYMGYTPGYVFRNLLTNTVGVLVDEGIGAFRHGFSYNAYVDDTADMLGFVPSGASQGIGGALGDFLNPNPLDNVADDIAKAGGRSGWFKKTPGTKFAAIGERFSSAQVINSSVRRTLHKVLKPGIAIPEINQLLDAGMLEDEARLLVHLAQENWGDVDKTAAAFAEASQRGYFEVWRNLESWVPTEVLDNLKLDQSLDRELRAILSDRNLKQSDIIAQWDELFNKKRRLAAANLKNHASLDDLADSALAEDARTLAAYEGFGDDANALLFDRIRWNEETMRIYGSAVDEVDNLLAQAAMDDTALKAQIFDIQNGDEFRAWHNGQEVRALTTEIAPKRHRALALSYPNGRRAASPATIKKWRQGFIDDAGGIEQAYEKVGLKMPEGATVQTLFDDIWADYRRTSTDLWDAFRDVNAEKTEAYYEAVGKLIKLPKSPKLDAAREALEVAKTGQKATIVEGKAAIVDEVLSNSIQSRKYAKTYGLKGGDKRTIATVNKFMRGEYSDEVIEGATQFEKLEDIPSQTVREALRARVLSDPQKNLPANMTFEDFTRIADEADAEPAKLAHTYIMPPPSVNPTVAEAAANNLPNWEKSWTLLKDGLRENWGKIAPVSGDAKTGEAVSNWLTQMRDRMEVVRPTAAKLANGARDFTLHGYTSEKRNIDLALGYIFPYQFWHTRTYQKWLTRVATNTGTIAAYGKYREMLEKEHAGLPDWWKFNISSDEILGIETDNPLFFNLEAAFNPLNSLTKEDFTDPGRRVNWWTSVLDDLGKLGPSTHTLISQLTAFGLYMQGKEDAAERWAGRLIPQTQALKSVTSLMGIGPAGGFEADPNVWLYGGGSTPFEDKRTARAIGTLLERYPDRAAEIFDAAYTQSGPLWEEAQVIAAHARDAGNLLSFTFGVGFKARSRSEEEVDMALNDWYRLWANSRGGNWTSDETRQAISDLHDRWPFLETVLLAQKGGVERDVSFAYNVLNRLPPGDNPADVYGIPQELVDKFWASSGHIEDWAETDRQRFMTGILDAAAILDVPDDTTQTEWDAARDASRDVWTQITTLYGDDIQAKIDTYYTLREPRDNAAYEAADDYLIRHPEVGQALDARSAAIMNSPILSAYYGGINKIESYYNGIMRTEIEKQLGADVVSVVEEYWALLDTSPTEAKNFRRNHPEIGKYYDLRDKYETIIYGEIIRVGQQLPEGIPAQIRDTEAASFGQEQILENATPAPEAIPADYYKQALGTAAYNQVLDFIYSDTPLDAFAQQALDTLAQQLGIGQPEVIDAIAQSIQ